LKYLIDFIDVKEVEKAKIYKDLKCSPEETRVLQFICRRFVKGMEETPVLDILQECFSFEGYNYLENLSIVKRVMDLGWIVQISFGQIKIQEVSKLEILNTSVAPSISLLRLLEEGSMEIALPEIKAYTDHLEYLQDQFDIIELLHKMSISKDDFTDSSLSLGRLKNKLILLSKRVEERLKITDEPIVVEEFFREKRLDDREQKIFLALLKEEYSGGEGQFRDMNTLIELISLDEYDKIRNRALLEDGSKLISEEIIDYEEILNMFGGISRSFYLQEEILQKISTQIRKKR
jgi:hypothetical protein